MKQPLTLKVIFVLLAANIGLQFWRLSYLVPDLGKWQQEQKQDLARWDEWERVGKAKVAAGSKTTFVPDPFRSKNIHRSLAIIKDSIVLAVLVIAVSIISAIGLFMGWRWTYRLAIGYASIGVGWGLLELMPVPSVINYALYYWHDWGAAMIMLSRGLLLHGVMLYCLLRPSVKAQFQKR